MRQFSGKVTIVEPDTAASEKLRLDDEITIPADGGSLAAGASTWFVHGASNGNNVIHGEIEGPYRFVICRGTKRVVGLVYCEPPGDGSDPGTWEADESGEPPAQA